MRLFVAVWPPPEVVDVVRAAVDRVAVDRVAGQDGAGGLRWTGPEQWHVTLRFFGTADLDDAVEAFRSVALPDAGLVGAEVGPSTGRFGRRVLHVPVAGLEGLAAAVVDATKAVGTPPDDRPFAGHLTLARARARGGADLSPWCGVPVAARWTVAELTLVASRTDREGARYEVVDRRSLSG